MTTFTQEETEIKVGQRVRTLADLFGIPKGTEGVVIRAEQGKTEWFAVVQWSVDGPGTGRRFSWFNHQTYSYCRMIEEVKE